jgi:hypothetical protein
VVVVSGRGRVGGGCAGACTGRVWRATQQPSGRERAARRWSARGSAPCPTNAAHTMQSTHTRRTRRTRTPAHADLVAVQAPLLHLGGQHLVPGVQHLLHAHALVQAADLHHVFIAAFLCMCVCMCVCVCVSVGGQ